MSHTLSDAIQDVRYETGSYSTGTNDNPKVINAINRSIEYIKRRLGLPSDEKIHNFLFCADQLYYDLSTDFDESILLKYVSDYYNTPTYEWDNFSYPDIVRDVGSRSKNRYAFTSINGRKQLFMSGSNIRGGQTLDAFEEIGDWTDEDDASGLALDTFQKYSGSGSLSFDISNSSGLATLQKTGLSLDMKDLFENNGYVKFWTFLTDDNIDDISIKLMTDNSNYYTIVEDDQDDGNAFTEDEWIKIGFPLNNAVSTGTPDSTNITKIRIEYDLGSGFTSATDFRADELFTVFPDNMDLVYYSSYKGTDTTGATNKILLDTVTDKIGIGEMFQDYRGIIAKKAAIILWPQLRGDANTLIIKKQEFDEEMKTLSRSFPRKRSMTGSYSHKLMR